MTTWLIPMSSQDQVKSLKSQDPLSLSSCRSQKYIVFLRYIRGGRGGQTLCNKCYLYFFKGVPLGLVLLLKTTTGSGVEALTWGGGCCVITCPVPCLTFDYWASLELTVTGGDRTIQSGQDWRQSNVGYRLQTYCDVIL